VVGGLGSAIGAGVGAALLVTAGVVLPSPWGAVATGFGVLCVVLFLPAGVSGVLVVLRDAMARALVPAGWRTTPLVDDRPEVDGGAKATDPVAIPAGADTRDALAISTVRTGVVAAWLLGAPAIVATFAAPAVLRDHVGLGVGAAAPWVVLGTTALSAVVATAGWRRRARSSSSELLIAAGIASALLAFVVTGDELMVAVVVLAAPVAAAWVLARLAAVAADAVVHRSRAAAAGLVVAAAAFGAVGAAHLAAVATNGILDAARWAIGYAAVGTGAFAAATAHAAADRARARLRDRAEPSSTERRRWAPLRIDELTVGLGSHRILDAVDLIVASGELLALAGGNGSGKSTLLRTAAGFIPAAAGRIDVTGSDITALRPDERAAAGVALVDGAQPVFPALTVRENLRVGAHLTHRTTRAFDRGVSHVLDVVPVLRDRLDTPVGALSGGEQRQLAVAQTLFRRPSVLLADELTLGLDADARRTVLALLRALADDGVGVVLVDHDLAAVAAVADRALVLHDGTLTELEDPALLAEAAGDLLPARFLAGATR
jgi:ABC-type branched-subunit amino acid transport system ATPase component